MIVLTRSKVYDTYLIDNTLSVNKLQNINRMSN